MEDIKIAIILGTRPEIIKLSVLIRKLKQRKSKFFVVHTNQHYDSNLDEVFFEDFELSKPRYNLHASGHSDATQLSKMMVGIEKVLLKEKPTHVVVQGDTNTAMAGALIAKRLGITLLHVEAGLRSYDNSMPEEINRIIADHCSDLLFAPTSQSVSNLTKESVTGKIIISGNTIVDSLNYAQDKIRADKIELEIDMVEPIEYCLLTLHRPSNVNNKERLQEIFYTLCTIPEHFVFPIHPRTKKFIIENKIEIPENIRVINPVDYFQFVILESNAKIIFTDSGGLQEEACILGIPCITIRDNTERPETVKIGANVLVEPTFAHIKAAYEISMNSKIKWKQPFGDGTASDIIINKIYEEGVSDITEE